MIARQEVHFAATDHGSLSLLSRLGLYSTLSVRPTEGPVLQDLYYMQGLNPMPLHGHAALFGVYGMLGIGLMCVGSLLPVGLAQTWASVEKGYWYVRSSEFLGLPYMQTLRWLRVPGDTIFAVAAPVLVAFVFVGRSGSTTHSEESLPDAVRVLSGD